MKVCVVGLGYIGLPTATLAAIAGHDVVGVDTNPAIVKSLNSGVPHIREPGLAELVTRAVVQGRLKAQESVAPADVFVIAVPTPITDSKTADLTCVKQATYSVAPHIRTGALFIVESTIPPGCTEDVIVPILEESGLTAGEDFHVAHCPERVLPGRAVQELVHNDRVIGAICPDSAEHAQSFYSTFVAARIFTTDLKQAELTKLAENAYRDVTIAFANELALVCQKLNVNVWEVIQLANRHPRVDILNPGPGVGGHCIAVDPWFLVEACPGETRLITAARQVNDERPERIVALVESELARCGVERPVVAALGLTYKADVADVRCSPAMQIVSLLKDKGFDVRACDPLLDGECPYPCMPVEKAVSGADALLLLVEHEEYLDLDLEALQEAMRHRIVIDTKGVWSAPRRDSGKPLPVAELGRVVDQVSA